MDKARRKHSRFKTQRSSRSPSGDARVSLLCRQMLATSKDARERGLWGTWLGLEKR